jgi:ATP-dependent helicase HepA
MNYRLGNLVVENNSSLGPAKLIQIHAGAATIEYFDSVAEDGRVQREVRLSSLKKYHVWPQTRVFLSSPDGTWQTGRVIQTDPDRENYLVKSSDDLRYVPEKDMYVRWNRPLENPLGVAAAGGFESPYYAERRHPFLAHLHRQRAASRGISAITSAVIEHHAHQLEIARRVLQDPVQRYLLADEVGLGKTIEAGLVVRQLLIDQPTADVLIICPPFLVDQWREELRTKFLTTDFALASVHVARNDRPDQWVGPGDYDLVIVDEAHHVAALNQHPKPELARRYEALNELAGSTSRLLLLSATPVLNNERTFLSMLHLLSPEVYAMDDLDSFRERVAHRKRIGEVFFSLVESTPAFLIREKIQSLQGLFPKDPQVQELSTKLASALGEGGDTASLIRRIRVHISETYRLHRRLLRTRRTKALAKTFPLAGRTEPVRLEMSTDAAPRLENLLDDWRETVMSRLSLSRSDSTWMAAVDVFADLLNHWFSDRAMLVSWARARASGTLQSPSHRVFPPDSGELDVLLRMVSVVEQLDPEQSRAWRIADLVLDKVKARDKAVIFCGFTEVADLVRSRLVDSLVDGEGLVARHTEDMDPAVAEAEVLRFEDPDSGCPFLVCDRSAEEGRNFQFATAIFHVDVPASPNRLEQRIGRLDRFQRARRDESAKAYVCVDDLEPPSYLDCWLACLSGGFGVFSKSIATLQYVVDELMPELLSDALERGSEAFVANIPRIANRLHVERKEVAAQDALDAVEVVEDEVDYLTSLRLEEDNWPHFERVSHGLLSRAANIPGNLRFASESDESGRTIYRVARSGDSVHINNMPLLPWGTLHRLQEVTGNPGVYERMKAVNMGRATRVFRFGEPLIEAVSEFLEHDDRGRLFALWRPAPELEGFDDQVHFRLDMRVEASTNELMRVVRSLLGRRGDVRAAQRRADEFLPPRLTTVWLDRWGEPVADPDLLSHLQRPYDKDLGDLNLNADRRHLLWRVVPEERWIQVLHEVQRAALKHTAQRLDLSDTCTEAGGRAQRIMSARIEQLGIRAARTGAHSDKKEFQLETELMEALLAGIEDPHISLDCFGVFVLSGRAAAIDAERSEQ